METLGEKLGPLLFQFGKFDKYAFKSLDDFSGQASSVSEKSCRRSISFAVEIRNKNWLVPKFADVLREHGVALTLIDQGWMPRALGDERQIRSDHLRFHLRSLAGGPQRDRGKKRTTWDEVIVDRQDDLFRVGEPSQEDPRAAHHDSGFCQ